MHFEGADGQLDAEPEVEAYRASYEYPSRPPSIAIPLALAELTDGSVTDFDPMYWSGSVDPDALDELFRPLTERDPPDASLSFTYDGYAVTVKADGSILLGSADSDSRPRA
ncbi:hypothetical protein BRC82_06745 [Halobacteriales archaeon QS_1_67_19]|nr:MAG: hypothetical protein BRC82_06745 [Halobacteriales archaeon QS_1_67_19]